MAWDDYDCGGVWILSGDKPFNEFGSAVKRLHKAFLDRWGRPPYLAELLYPLLRTIEMQTNRPVADETLPSLEAIISLVGGLTEAEHIEPGDFEGATEEESEDFVIYPRSNPSGAIVVRGDIEHPGDGTITARYEITSPTISDRMAHCLIRDCVLHGLMRIDLADPDISLRFERRSPGSETG